MSNPHVDINSLQIGKWYTVMALRYVFEDKPVWTIVAEGNFYGTNRDNTECYFVTDKTDQTGYVYDQNIDTIIKQKAINNKYRFIS